MKYLFGLILCVCISRMAYTQTTSEYRLRIVDEESGEPLPGATVQFTDTNLAAVADTKGEVRFVAVPAGTYTIEIRFLGYRSENFARTFPLSQEQPEQVNLHPEEDEMEAIVVQSTRSSTLIADNPTRVEVIAGEELAEKGNMKPGDIRMLLNESTGIQTQQTSATSYNSSIRIQGLDGKYTQLLRDGLPLYAGYSGGLSLMQIPPLDLAQVEVIKGSASTLYGGGAIAGLVNLISKRPQEDGGLDLMVNGTSALGLDASGFYSGKSENLGTTVFVSYNKGNAYDPSTVGLTAIPEFDRISINPRVFWNPDEDSELMLGLNWTNEDRLGGNLAYIRDEPVKDPYFERNQTDRFSTQLRYEQDWGDGKVLELKNSLNFFNRKISLRDYRFAGRQFSSFSELNFRTQSESAEWSLGTNLWTENFDQTQGAFSEPLDYQLNTLGAFVQNIWNPAQKWTLETGFRLDYQQDYGLFPLPRLSLMVEPSEHLTFRLGGGLGYKSPTVFSEEAERISFRNVRPIDPSLFDAERSSGANLDVNYKIALSEELTLNTNTLFFHTRIQDPLMLVAAGSAFEFRQPEGRIRTQGMELNLKWNYRDWKLFTGYTFSDVDERRGGDSEPYPLVARHRLNNVLMYEKHEEFWIGLEAYYFSRQLLNDGQTGQPYWILGLMSERKFADHFSVFLNFENFLDTRQTAFDTIYTGSISDPQFRDIYAPVDGFVINGGFKLHL
ncbi:iron complex outermembrane recepter protein [Cyclobacterium lianum]|uniref:Iron complex outermembrane recepter protein n=1 Tax=Cyclobacterium lianum TaxID=388280 RepID=A0A1M7N427_9BACT|nr:TonB-dependent receptor [Cyclobacterium lianum]SHM98125.1 iron complex outermembrane recepter protein [Cyclobacterium lianum]